MSLLAIDLPRQNTTPLIVLAISLCLAWAFCLLALSFTDRGALWWIDLPGVMLAGKAFLFLPLVVITLAWILWASMSS